MTDLAAIARVHGAIFQSWRRFVSEAEAREQADGFVRRFFAPSNDKAELAADYDRMLARLAEIVADASPRAAAVLTADKTSPAAS
jgi:hypothetical protein